MLIAGFYLFYFMSTGLLVPYLPTYLKETLKFNGTDLSTVWALTYAGQIFIPPLWGMLSDRTRRPARLLKYASVITVLSFAAMLFVRSYAAVFAVMALYAICVAPIITLADTVAVFEARRIGTHYGRLRIFGSLGYLVSGSAFSAYLNITGRNQDVVPTVLCMMLGFAFVSMFNNPPPIAEGRKTPPSFHDAKALLLRPSFALFLAALFVHWTALASYYSFFTIHLSDLHAKQYMWITIQISVAMEMVLMWTLGSILRRVPVMTVIVVASFITSARWLLISQMTNGYAVAWLQGLHCFTFAVCYVGSIAYMEQNVPTELLATGRALFSSLVMGLGGVVGTLLAGRLYDWGHGHVAFWGSGILELFTPLLLYFSWRAWKKSARQPIAVSVPALEPVKDPNVASVPTEAV